MTTSDVRGEDAPARSTATTTGIVVGVDGSPGARAALRWAEAEGTIRGVPVTAVLAWGLLDQHHPDLGDRFDADYDEGRALEALDAYVGAGGDVRRRVVNDLPAPALLDASAEADLLVVGGRGLGRFQAWLLGSVSARVVAHARCPTAVVHGDGDRAGDSIVVGYDGSPGSHAALAWAMDEGRARGLPVRAVNAYGDHPLSVAETAPTAADTTGVAMDVVVTPEPPAPTLLDLATDAALVVVGTRGAGGFPGLHLGSVSHQVVTHAPCPVVVVPPPGNPHT